MADPFKYFRVEAKELADQLQKDVLELEQGGGARAVQRLLRAAHTLKGAARVVKQREIADTAHALEDVLGPFRDGDSAVTPEAIATLLGHVDTVARLVAMIASPTPAPARAPAAEQAPAQAIRSAEPRPANDAFRSVRADVAEMDSLLESVAEAHVQLSAVRESFVDIERAHGLSELLCDQVAARQREQRALAQAAPAAGGTSLLATYSVAEELRGVLGRVERRLSLAIDQAERELLQVRSAAQGMRLLPVSVLFAACERAARDAAHALGKQVRVQTEGGNVRLEADALLILQGALIQLARNAVAHGIELPAERLSAGKPAVGTIRFEIKRRGERVACICRDDGRGIDLEAVRSAAVRRGLIASTASPGASELIDMLLDGGITTTGRVTEVSGRGIGLDVVREAALRLSGAVSMGTTTGQGTWTELVVPMSLASFAALRVQAGDMVAAIPMDAIVRTLRVEARDIAHAATGQQIVVEGRAMPFMPLSAALGLPSTPGAAATSWSSVIIKAADARVAIGADRLLDTTHAVLKPLGAYAPANAGIAGTLLDARGAPELVLDPEGLIATVLQGSGRAPSDQRKRHAVLVIDDSLTTRMLEQSILESAGYDVEVAASAEEGLEKALRDNRYALFLVDVEMPGIDGFEFVARTQQDQRLRDTPAILVTSRNAPEDHARGMEVGARGYIVKSEFDQVALLGLIQSLLR
jgi:two-component system chemotaxis sensor kinase CheA